MYHYSLTKPSEFRMNKVKFSTTYLYYLFLFSSGLMRLFEMQINVRRISKNCTERGKMLFLAEKCILIEVKEKNNKIAQRIFLTTMTKKIFLRRKIY
jgi:hypothetical protein